MRNNKKSKLAFLFLFQCLLAPNLFSQTTPGMKPDVIFICVDDLSIAFDTYDNPQAPAPNFARLMQHGVLFKQTYVQYPLCSPSRTSILSGKRPDSTGVFHNWIDVRTVLGPDYRFLPEYFHDYGYRTGRFGKVGPCGHEDAISWDFEYKGPPTDVLGFQDFPNWWVDTLDKTREETRDGIFTDGLIKTLQYPLNSPAFYALGIGTHNPFSPILSEWNKVGDSSNKVLVPVDQYGTITNVYGNGSSNILLPDTPPDDTKDIPPAALKELLDYSPEETRNIRHAYYSEIIEMDNNLGKLLDALDSMDAWKNSVIVFWSDHGLHMGEHQGLWLKMTLFEESLRVPFVICAPGKQRNIVCNSPVELVDIYPTLTELCGLPKPARMEGSSLVPLLENPSAPWKKAIFSQRVLDTSERKMARSARTARYQYNNWDGDGEELYDIKNDPHEYTNLVLNRDYDSVLNRMRNLLLNGWKDAFPPAYTQSVYYKDKDKDGYGTINDSLVAYFMPPGYTDKKGDCNDSNPRINPAAPENMCNGVDDNCNGSIDENKPKPQITAFGNLDICKAGTVLLKTNTNNGFKYQWTKNGTIIPGATKAAYRAVEPGNYQVGITYQIYDCSNVSDLITVTNSCGQQKISVSPNPSPGILNIYYNASIAQKVQLTVHDKTGKILFTKNVQVIKGNNTIQENVSWLIDGFYTVQINNGEEGRANFVIAK